jgi:hypothetical protein
MSPIRCIIALLVTLLFVRPGSAQEFFPWPPVDPQQLFGANVEILEQRLRSSDIERENGTHIDNDRRFLRLRDGRNYPLPPEMEEASSVLFETNEYVYVSMSRRDDSPFYWQFNLATSEWRPYGFGPGVFANSFCGSVELYLLGSYPRWIVIIGRNNQQHLCNLDNGLISPPLPAEYHNWSVDQFSSIDDYLLVVGDETTETTIQHHAYILNLATHDILYVDTLPALEDPYRDWVTTHSGFSDGTLFVSITASPTGETIPPQRHNYYVFPNEGSVKSVPDGSLSHYRAEIGILETRLETAEAYGFSCEISSYDLNTGQTITYRVETSCYQEYSSGEFDYYRVVSADLSQADLIRVDVRNGESEIVYSGEIEGILLVSDDVRYGVLAIDDSGQIDILPNERYQYNTSFSNAMTAVLLDLETGITLYETTANWFAAQWQPIVRGYPNGLIGFVGDAETILIDIENLPNIELVLSGLLGNSIGEEWAFLFPPINERINEVGAIAQLDVFNIISRQTYRLIDLGEFSLNYYLKGDFEYIGNNEFRLTIGYDTFPYPDPFNPLYDLVTYTVRVNEGD